MTTTTQNIPPTPAQRLAAKIRARTNDLRDVLDVLHDIAQGGYDATANDQIAASRILFDRGYGKVPKSDPAPETAANAAGVPDHESPTPESPAAPRPVTQLDNALHDSLGPPPKADNPPTHSSLSTNHSPLLSPIQSIIQQHVIDITNDGDTLLDVLTDIYRTPDDDPDDSPKTRRRNITAYHRRQAGKILMDRGAGAIVAPADPGQPWSIPAEEKPFDKELWDGIIANLRQLEDDGVITPDPNYVSDGIPIRIYPMSPEEAAEEAAKFIAENALKIERQKAWPEIEELRRKKLAQIYPSHSDDSEDEPPDT